MYFTFPSLAHIHSCISVYTVIHNTHKHIHKYTESFICFDPFVFSICFKLNLKVWFSFSVCLFSLFLLLVCICNCWASFVLARWLLDLSWHVCYCVLIIRFYLILCVKRKKKTVMMDSWLHRHTIYKSAALLSVWQFIFCVNKQTKIHRSVHFPVTSSICTSLWTSV